jgi:phage protein D
MFKWLTGLFTGNVEAAKDEAKSIEKTISAVAGVKKVETKVEKIVEVEAKTVKATKASLSKLTKQGLEDFAKTNYKVDIDKRKKKADLVAEVLKLAKNAK